MYCRNHIRLVGLLASVDMTVVVKTELKVYEHYLLSSPVDKVGSVQCLGDGIICGSVWEVGKLQEV